MTIEKVKIGLSQDVPVKRLDNSLVVGDDISKGTGIEKVQVIFNGHYNVEITHKKKDDEIVVVITSGGVSKEIDLSTFHQLITMNY